MSERTTAFEIEVPDDETITLTEGADGARLYAGSRVIERLTREEAIALCRIVIVEGDDQPVQGVIRAGRAHGLDSAGLARALLETARGLPSEED